MAPAAGLICRARVVNWLNVAPASCGDPVNDVAGSAKVGDAFALPILRDAAKRSTFGRICSAKARGSCS